MGGKTTEGREKGEKVSFHSGKKGVILEPGKETLTSGRSAIMMPYEREYTAEGKRESTFWAARNAARRR